MFINFKKKNKRMDDKSKNPVWLLDEEYYRILDKQMSDDPDERLQASIEMCQYMGVRNDKIMKSVY